MKYKSDNDFKGIIESFTKTESKGGHVILRTDENQRSGLYFTVTFNNSLQLLPSGCLIRLSFVTNNTPTEQVQTWEMPEAKHSLLFQNEIYLGITNSEKALASASLVAWKVEILSHKGQVLATQKSYAWE